jgi:cytochrome oxidase Cu insertion factor (SCO1/SenC/PrrC family)
MSKRTSTLLVAMASCLLAAGASPAQNKKGSYFGKVLPEIDSKGTYWINAQKGLTLKALRGGPTLVCYNFLG